MAVEIRLEQQPDDTWKLTGIIRKRAKERVVELVYECNHLIRLTGLCPGEKCLD